MAATVPSRSRPGSCSEQLEQPADGRLARARQLQGQNQTAAAIATLEELVLTYPATETAVKAGQVLAGLTKE
jgi:TolA-binding protein